MRYTNAGAIAAVIGRKARAAYRLPARNNLRHFLFVVPQAHLLTRDEAWRIAANIAKLPEAAVALTKRAMKQGLCCHEAGHAVVAFSLGVRVVAVSIFFTEKEGWKGDTKTEGTDHLPWKDQIMLRIAGKAGEEFFNCPEDPRVSLHDLGEIVSLLDDGGERCGNAGT